MPPEIARRPVDCLDDSSNMADTVLVAPTFKSTGSTAHNIAPAPGPLDNATLGSTPSTEEPFENDGMSSVKRYFQTNGLSEQAVNLLMQSWRGSTKKQYACYINQWTAFCAEKQVDNICPPVASVLDFLTELYHKGLKHSSINTARSALSTFILSADGKPIGQHPLVSRLLKGIYQVRPNTPKYRCIWDVNIVLRYLAQLHPLKKLSLRELTYKVVMLMLLVSGQRGQTIHLLDLKNMIQQ
jgi:hypothetical protein